MYRQLSQSEIKTLLDQGCIAENWSNILIKDPFPAEQIRNVHFVGNIRLGTLTGKVQLEENVFKPSVIRNCYIENCTIGDNVYLSDISSLINYTVEDRVAVEKAGIIAVTGETSFGNGHEIDVLNEGGGRELPIFDRLSAQIAYLLVVYRHNKPFIRKLKSLVNTYVEGKKSTKGHIAENSRIQYSKSIINVNIGPGTIIRGASLLKEGTIASNQTAPVFIGEDVVAENFIVLSGSRIDGGSIISSTFVGQGVQLGKQYSAENSTFFANCEGFHGEACSLFAGPYTVTHHKSSLLIAGMFSFFNAGSGSNQSNHMYKLGPIHQGIIERGSKTGSFSYMLWPCRLGAFSVVMDKHNVNFDTSDLPFSYVSQENGKSVLTPAMNLFTVGTSRDSKKWPKRDRRKDAEKLDLITFDLFNPFTIQRIIKGSDLLAELHESTPKTREFASLKGIHINRLMLRTSKRYYDLAVNVYLTKTVVDRLKINKPDSIASARKILSPGVKPSMTKWIDIFGLIIDTGQLNNLIHLVIEENIQSIEELLIALREIHKNYSETAYAWTAAIIKERLNIDVENISKSDLLGIISDWKTNSVKFNKMILKDAEKEFDKLSKTGYGHDGDEQDQISDFESIRGTYETNSFIISLNEENSSIELDYDALCKRIEKLPD